MLGLPDGIVACLFDLDGVLTKTAKVHAAAWKQMFDEYLEVRAERTGEAFVPFDTGHDYNEYVDGKPRDETVDGLGNRKNELVIELIERQGVEAYEGSVRYVRAARDAGLRRAVVS